MPNDFDQEFNEGFLGFSEVDKTLAERQPLYVKNTTQKPARILVIDYPTAEGGRAFHVPRTPIPFNICDFVDPEALRSSDSFRRMINSGALDVIDVNKAKALLADPETRRSFVSAYNEANKTHQHRATEVEKTRQANAAIREEQQRAQSGAMKNMISAMEPGLAKALNITNAEGQRPEPKLLAQRNPRLAALEARVKGGLSGATLLQELSLMLGDLDIDDLQAIAAGAYWPPEAQKWARERVAFATKALGSGSKGA